MPGQGEPDPAPDEAPAPTDGAPAQDGPREPATPDGRRRRRGGAWKPAAAAFAVLLAFSGIWLAADLDLDGATAYRELQLKTDPLRGDTDADGLADGWELQSLLDPLSPDSDRDGVLDPRELGQGSDPLASDSDRDGIPDAVESPTDCDADGRSGVLEGDDDADGRVDGLEAEGDRCSRDGDGDGVPDGSEGAAACIRDPDCDRDGLPDGSETSGFDPLDPDSFSAGVHDSVVKAFQEAGQAPSGDADQDGIPDGWESSDGLVAWGALRPAPGRKDLLLEYIRVAGPDSGRFADLDFLPAYRSIADRFLAEAGIHVQWVETRLAIPADVNPPLLPSSGDPYYADLLQRAAHSANPFATTVVLNPQHDQREVLHAGVAPIRGVLAAIDYGQHVRVLFEVPSGRAVALSPFWEEMVRGDRQDLIRQTGFDAGSVAANGDIVLRSDADRFTVRWTPAWFRSPPVILPDKGNATQLRQVGATVDQPLLAQTILHEVGHTLGLCHTHLADCQAAHSPRDRQDQALSTMSYDAAAGTLHFLPSEWKVVADYLTCPPQEPLVGLARGDSAADVRQAKYGYTEEALGSLSLRACAARSVVQRTFDANDPPPASYRLPEALAHPAAPGPWSVAVAFAAAGVLSAAALAWWVRRRVAPAHAAP